MPYLFDTFANSYNAGADMFARMQQRSAADDKRDASVAQSAADDTASYQPTDTTVQNPDTPAASATSGALPDPSQPVADVNAVDPPDSEKTRAASDPNGLFGKDGSVNTAALQPAAGTKSDTASKIADKVVQKAAAALTSMADTSMDGPDGYMTAAADPPGPAKPAGALQQGAPAPMVAAGPTPPMMGQTSPPPLYQPPAAPASPPVQTVGVQGMPGSPSGPAAGPALAQAAQPTVGGRPMPGAPAPTMAGGGPVQTAGVQGAPGSPSGAPVTPTTGALQQGTADAAQAPNPPPGNDASGAAPSLGSRILSALNPISSASAQELPARRTTVGQPTPGSAGAPALPMAKTDDGDAPSAGASNAYVDPVTGAETKPLAADTPAVATTAPSAKPAPSQVGPTDQTEPTPAYVTPPFTVRPWHAIAMQKPEIAKIVQQAATDTGVSPARLAAHWWMESGLHPTAPVGAAGEIGPMQIMPATIAANNPGGKYDPNTLDGALHIAGNYINKLDAQFGVNTVASVASYNGGPGVGQQLQAGKSINPTTTAYLAKLYPGQDLGPQNIVPPVNVDPVQAKQALQAGPDTFIRYIASVTPPGVPMGAAWRAAEIQGVYAHDLRGDSAGAQQWQEDILQASRQGASMSLMNADRALAAGDGVGAAQQLAKAHAFFPDGTMGRFGVDKSGNVWASRVSEDDPSLQIGKPFQVTRQDLQRQLLTTQDPNKYAAMVQQQQAAAAQAQYLGQHANYYSGLLDEKNAAEKDQLKAREEAIAGREQTAALQSSASLAKAQLAAASRNPGLTGDPTRAGQVDKETQQYYGDGAMIDGQVGTPKQLGDASLIYSTVRHNGALGMMPPARAHDIASGTITGRYHVIPQKDGGAAVVDPKTNATLTYLPPQVRGQLFGMPQPAAAPTPALGMAYNPAMSSGTPPAPTSTAVH